MLTADALPKRNAALATRMRRRLGLRGVRGLEETYARTKRHMPGAVQEDVQRLIEAEGMLAHPKMQARMDPTGLEAGYRRVERWLRKANPTERRKNFWLDLAAANAFNFLVVGAVVVVLLQAGGHL